MRTITAILISAGLLIATATTVPAATSSDLLRCGKAIRKGTYTIQKLIHTKVGKCALKVSRCQIEAELGGSPCTPVGYCVPLAAKVAYKQTALQDKVKFFCLPVTLPELEQWPAGLGFSQVVADCGAADVNGLIDCVIDDARCSGEHQLFVTDPRAEDALTFDGSAASFPCVN